MSRRGFLAAGAGVAGAAALGAAGVGTTRAEAATSPLPRVRADFHWGVACSGFLSEGHPLESNWTRFIAARTKQVRDPYLNSVDFLHRYRDDIALAAAMGLDTFRFSVEWPRVQPAPGQWSEEGLAFYDDVLATVLAAGLRPMITLSHFTHPGWVVDHGGWVASRTVDDFVAYAHGIVSRYAGKGANWITFNEPFAYVLQEIGNNALVISHAMTMNHNLAHAHTQTYDVIHQLDPGAMVTSNTAYFPGIYALTDTTFLDLVQHKLDFFGLDYYYGLSLTNLTSLHQLSDFEVWKIKPAPQDLYWALRYYHSRYPQLPIWIVENGMATDNGLARPDGYTRSNHLRDHVYWMQRAIADHGIDVIGYNYWSLTDNYEWGWYRPRFGLYTVDVLTDPSLTRKPTDGVATYRDVVAAGGVAPDYRPVAPGDPLALGFPPISLLPLP